MTARVALSADFEDEAEARAQAESLNHAYELGAATTAYRAGLIAGNYLLALSRIADRDVHGMDIKAIREEAQAALDKVLPSVPPSSPTTAAPVSSPPPSIEDSGAALPPTEGLLERLVKDVVIGDPETRQAVAEEKGGEG